MKKKKITAWILFVAMVLTMLPNIIVSATPGIETYPTIVTDVFSEMTNDISNVTKGTDLDLSQSVNEKLPEPITDVPELTDTVEGTDSTVCYLHDSEINRMRRKQILTFVAKSQSDSNFINPTTETGVAEHAVEIAYMDVDRHPIKIATDSNTFEIDDSVDATWENSWIDLSTDVQQTPYTLESFLNGAGGANTKQLTAAQLFATGDQVSFMIYNVIRSDFAGYLRVKITDNNGYATVKDYPIIADGQYPAVSIKTSTLKNPVGGNVEAQAVTNIVKNTFINEMDFVTSMSDTDENRKENETDVLHHSYRWNKLDKDALQKALNWEDEKYKPENIWAMNDVCVDEIAISDLLITSGIDSVKYSISNYKLKEGVVPSTLEGATSLVYDPLTKKCKLDEPIKITEEGFNVLAITATDKAGLKTTNRFYFYIDKTAPIASYKLDELNNNVLSLFTVADVVTNRQQAIDMSASKDDDTKAVKVISELEKATDGDATKNTMYQYRLLATKEGATEGGNVPDGYTATVVDKKGNNIGGWKAWAGNATTPIIDKEFDGIIQVRVQDKAGNWSPIVSKSSDNKETIITDNTNPVISVNEYALNTNGDTVGYTKKQILDGTAENILDKCGKSSQESGKIKNEIIDTISGDVCPWINDSAILEVNITDADLLNNIRSSGLDKGLINVSVEFNKGNETKEILIWNKNKTDVQKVTSSFDLTSDYLFGSATDKKATFYIQYDGTGVADITVSVKDQADVSDKDVFSTIYQTQLKVDKINPYITYKGFDVTDVTNQTDLLKPNTAKKDYELRDMPWGPNSQVLEVIVKDDDVTPVQSKTANIKFNSDKPLKLYKLDAEGKLFDKDGKLNAAVKEYPAGKDNVIALTDCTEVANEKYPSNVGYKFYLVYEGTGIAKVEFFADDSATKANVRDYPSVVTKEEATPVEYDVMMRVDKINPVISDMILIQTDKDVEDTGWSLFTFNKTDVDINTRRQMMLKFNVSDNDTTEEQSGVVVKSELTDAQKAEITKIKDDYVSSDKTHLYNNSSLKFKTNSKDEVTDVVIDYILLPVKAGEKNGTGLTGVDFTGKTNEEIEKIINSKVLDKDGKETEEYVYLGKTYNKNGDKCEWKHATWTDGGIVVPDEFQGAIVVRTIDRVGNVDYAEAITFVAESNGPQIKFLPQKGYIYSQNNYGWSKRDWDYIDIRVKDDNIDKVDSWLENVFIKVEEYDTLNDTVGNEITCDGSKVMFCDSIHSADSIMDKDSKPDDIKNVYKALDKANYDYLNMYGVDVIKGKGNVEEIERDKDGYIHLGYIRVSTSAKITITMFDKAEDNELDFSGNCTTAEWISRIDRTAPIIDKFDVINIFEGEKETDNNNGYGLVLSAHDVESGIAPAISDKEYNLYSKIKNSFLYRVDDIDDGKDPEVFESGIINGRNAIGVADQYEMPGLQYALIPENGKLENVKVWDFETDPMTNYPDAKTGYYNGEFGKTYVWHNYVDEKVPVIPAGFDGYIAVRAIDKAGNITVLGYSPIFDVEFDDTWNKDTQFVHVKASPKCKGTVSDIKYFGNNDLLYPKDARRDLNEALEGEGAIIEVTEEGITNIVVTGKEDYAKTKPIQNSAWEGDMNLGNLISGDKYQDWKFQFADVKIDKTNPEFKLQITDKDGKALDETRTVTGTVTIKADGVKDPIPNIPDELGYRSHIPSEVAKVEWCAVPEGSEQEKWEALEAPDYTADFDATAFTGTIKVRVIDNAGNEYVLTQKINIDEVPGLVNVSKTFADKWSKEPVTVFVTVSKDNAEYSDIAEVTYTITKDDANKTQINGVLPLTGGTIAVDWDGITNIKVTAKTKGGVVTTDETDVKIDMTVPEFELVMRDSKNTPLGDANTANLPVSIRAKNLSDATSKIAKVEWCAINEGTSAENWVSVNSWSSVDGNNEVKLGELSATEYIRTIKVRVTDNAGNVTEKSKNLKTDAGKPIITIDRLEKPDDKGVISVSAKKEDVVIGIAANKGTCTSEIKSLTYKIAKDGSGEQTKYLNPTGGNIVLSDEGIWNIKEITVTMESGITYVMTDSNNKQVSVMASIDRTAPEITATISPIGSNDSDLALFSVSSRFKQKLDVIAVDTLSGVVKLEYAVVEKGVSEPEWKTISNPNSSTVHNVGEIISKAFDGTVLVRATDGAGNVAVVSQTVFTEGVRPEISLTAPAYGWTSNDAYVTVDILDKGTSSQIEYVTYELQEYKKVNGVRTKNGAPKTGKTNGSATENWAKLNSNGGTIIVADEGDYTLTVIAYDYAGNDSGEQSVDIKIDKTAPTYSGSVKMSLFNVHDIPESDWDVIHDGWTYNHDVSLNGVVDSLSGIKNVEVTFTGKDGTIKKNDVQTNYMFSSSGKYDVKINDNAGNIRNISFTIDKDLKHTINVIEVDSVGKLNVAVTDGNERLTFYQKDEDSSSFKKMFNGVTDQFWDGTTGVRQIYAVDDNGNKTNTLYVLVAPSEDYEVNLMNLTNTPNRYFGIDLNGENVTVVKTKELFNANMNKSISVGSELELTEDGIYTITIK